VTHAWVKSTLGHGETMCDRCGITNREAAVLGMLNECPRAGTKPRAETYRHECPSCGLPQTLAVIDGQLVPVEEE
jgi:hypothetical protein